MKKFLIYLGIILTILVGYNLIPAKYPTTYFGTESSLDSLIDTGLFYPMCLKENAYVIRKNPFPINENELIDMDNIRINNTLTKYDPILESYLNKHKTDWFKELSYKATSVRYGILGSDKYMKYINDNTILRLSVSEDKKNKYTLGVFTFDDINNVNEKYRLSYSELVELSHKRCSEFNNS